MNGTDGLLEMDWDFEKEHKSFGTVLKIWQKNTCVSATFLETLQAAICLG